MKNFLVNKLPPVSLNRGNFSWAEATLFQKTTVSGCGPGTAGTHASSRAHPEIRTTHTWTRVRAGKKSTEGKKMTPISLVFEPRASM